MAQILHHLCVPIIALPTSSNMSAKLVVDRHFLVLRGLTLAVFSERILRATQQHPSIECPAALWQQLDDHTRALREVLDVTPSRSRERLANQRSREARVRQSLDTLALFLETTATCKYDLFTAGFGVRADKSDRQEAPSRRMRRHQAAVQRVAAAV